MNHTLLTLWTTLDGTYYSNTANYASYDAGIGEYHAKFKPLQNDSNVASFRLLLIDENGKVVDRCAWTRPVEATEETTEDVESGI